MSRSFIDAPLTIGYHLTNPMQELKGKYSGMWSARDILYYYCGACGHHLPWRRYNKSNVLVSSCCGFIYNAEPMNEATRFKLTVGKADTKNVVILSIVDWNDGAS